MKSIIVNYKVMSDLFEKPQRIILISDLHGVFSNKKLSNQLINDINSIDAHHVCIAGDIMQGYNYSNLSKCNELSYFLDALGEAHPVFLSLGNHDLVGLSNSGRRNFRCLGGYNVYPLDNEVMILDQFRIIGFSPKRSAYVSSNQANGTTNELFAEQWNNSGLYSSDSKYFEELIGHNPHHLANAYVFNHAKGIRNFNLYLTGHMHGGYVPNWYKESNLSTLKDKGLWDVFMEKDKTGKITKIRPWLFTPGNLCRGMHYVGENGIVSSQYENGLVVNKEDDSNLDDTVPLVISGGVNRYFGLPVSPEITTIDIVPEGKKLVKKL